MKMTATWFRSERGLAIGVIVGALTVGKATPYLVRAIPHVGVRPVVLTSSVGAAIAAILVATTYRDGRYPFAARRFCWGQVGDVVRVREWRLATSSYLGHMFELYSYWTWIPAFLAASAAALATRSSTMSTAASPPGRISSGSRLDETFRAKPRRSSAP